MTIYLNNIKSVGPVKPEKRKQANFQHAAARFSKTFRNICEWTRNFLPIPGSQCPKEARNLAR